MWSLGREKKPWEYRFDNMMQNLTLMYFIENYTTSIKELSEITKA